MSTAPTPTRRESARVLVVDKDDRLLLFSYAARRQPYASYAKRLGSWASI